MSGTIRSQTQPKLLSIYPTQTNDGNPFDNYRILKQMGHLASKADLTKLNGINSNYYVSLQSDHLDAAGKRTLVIKHSPYARSIVKDGSKCILAEDWNSGLAKFYNKLEMDSLFFLGPVPNGIPESLRLKLTFANSIIQDVCQYITTLQLNRVGHIEQPFHVDQTGEMTAGFLNKFPNLMKLKIRLDNDTDAFSQAQLENLLIGITQNKNIQITVKIDDLDNVPSQERPSFQLDRIMMLFPNIKLEFYLNCRSDWKLQELVTIYNLYRASIEGIGLLIRINNVDMSHQTIATCLTQLCPILTSLNLQLNNYTQNWNVLEGDKDWPNLLSLSIEMYNGPLDILKHCPKLEKLDLRLNQTTCIFHNTNQTAQEDIKEYFGNLKQLKKLTFAEPLRSWLKADPSWFWFLPGKPLYVFLKTLLPEGVKIRC